MAFENYKLGARVVAVSPARIPVPADLYNAGKSASRLLTVTRKLGPTAEWLGKRQVGLLGYHQIGVGACSGMACVPTTVGGLGVLQMGPGELLDEIKMLDGEILALGREIMVHYERLGCNPLQREGDCGKLNQFMRGPWGEFLISWSNYKDRHESWLSRVWADPNQLKRFRQRFVGMHEEVGKIVPLLSPVPSPDPKGFFEKPADIMKSLFGLMKTVLFILLGIGGAMLLLGIVREFRR